MKNEKGHLYVKLFGKNILILYRHTVYEFQNYSNSVVLAKRDISFADIDFDLIDNHVFSEFDTYKLRQDAKRFNEKFGGIMAMAGDIPIGYLTYYLRGSNTIQYKIRKADAYIDSVCVNPSYRGLNIAPALLAFAVEYLQNKGFSSIKLAVRRNNISMKNCLQKTGFIAIEKSISLRFLSIPLVKPQL